MDAEPASPKLSKTLGCILVKRVTGVPSSYSSKSCYFVASVDNQTPIKSKSVVAKGDVLEWNQKLLFETRDSSVFQLKLRAARKLHSDTNICEIRENLAALIPSIPSDDVICFLPAAGTDERVGVVLSFPDLQAQLDDVHQQATDYSSLSSSSTADQLSSVVDNATAVVSTIDPIANGSTPLLNNLRAFMVAVNCFAEIHPYTKMAWIVVSSAYKIYEAQVDRDQNMKYLVDQMNRVHLVIIDAQVIESHRDILWRMTQHTIECGHLISAYFRDKRFVMRTLKNLISGVDNAIKSCVLTFEGLLLEFQGEVVLRTEIGVLRILADIRDVSAKIDFADMPYAVGAGYQRGKQCLAGTREKILDDITDWINNSEATQRVCLLSGPAGTGKSAIAHTIAHRFDKLGRLGSSFFFDQSDAVNRSPKTILPTLARGLADLDLSIQRALGEAIRSKAKRETIDLNDQFDAFILNTIDKVTMVGPIVVVIDALDESGDVRSRRSLLAILASRMQELPSNFRILITSRPEDDITTSFSDNSNILTISMPKADVAKMSIYVCAQLVDVKGQRLVGFNDDICSELAMKSEGLFQWAYVVCEVIKGDGKGGSSPMERFHQFMASTSSGRGLLDDLYFGVLSRLFDTSDALVMSRFRSVMGHVLTVFEPLPVSSLTKIQQHLLDDVEDVENVLKFMGPLLSGVGDQCTPIQPLHTSFRDFILDPARARQFYVDTAGHHAKLSLATMRILNSEELHFNMCNLETSYLRNADVEGLEDRVQKQISSHLSYSCRFWARHLQATASDSTPLYAVKSLLYSQLIFFWDRIQTAGTSSNPFFQAILSITLRYSPFLLILQHCLSQLHTSNFVMEIQDQIEAFLCKKLLFWLEALSLLKVINVAPKALAHVVTWIAPVKPELAKLANDAQKFVRMFGAAMAESAPHIYLSALPFTPRQSLLSQHFRFGWVHTARVPTGHLTDWPALQGVLTGHTDFVRSVAFSPDGTRIASGSQDKTIRVWDAETGKQVLNAFEGHTRSVMCVAFSPDGTRIASGSGDNAIRVWDAETGKQMSSAFEGHTDWVRSVIFSPDGTRIASGSEDITIRVWNAETGKQLLTAFEGHTDPVMSVAFSPNGTRIASGSGDNTIRVWDVETGKQILNAFEGHTDWIMSVAFSPDGTRITSGSHDKTIRVWNAETGRQVLTALIGHTDLVLSVAFSPDGTHIASGSGDKTIRVWDAETGEQVSTAFEGHTDCVLSVAFSPDGTRITSGSEDNTIRVWDTEAGKRVLTAFEGHNNSVMSVAFSPNGTHIASGSHDMTIRVWDARTGKQILNAFEGHTRVVLSVAFSPDGTRIASGSGDTTIRVWDSETGKQVSTAFEGHTNCVLSVAFSPDGSRIASGSSDNTIRVWDAKTGKQILNAFEGHTDWVRSVAFSPDGTRIVSGSEDNTIRVWYAETGKQVSTTFEGHTDWVRSVAFSPDGICIASGSEDRTIRLWDAETGKQLLTAFEGHTDWVRSVAFSSDGTRIASASEDKTVRVWDVETGEQVSTAFEGHTKSVMSVAFSPDGTRIASGSYDNTIRVWDAKTGKQVPTAFDGLPDSVMPVALSSDGTRITSGSVGNTIRVWDAQTMKQSLTPFEEHTNQNGNASFHSNSMHVTGPSLDGPCTMSNISTSRSFAFSPHSSHALVLSPGETDIITSESVRYDSINNGWIVGLHGELLFWVPPELRKGLWQPRNTAVMGVPVTTLDLSSFVHGRRWTECYSALAPGDSTFSTTI